ncbi:MAG: hypothetical protein JW986_09390 [Methanotrichaceae archaeon]|nr:hypothetical protein [Methanotrichaceae archaeon]
MKLTSIVPVFMALALWLGFASADEYFIVGSEGFVPGSNVDYFNTYGCGGAYIASGSGALVAPVHLPQGATVTEFKVFFYDNSQFDMTVYLDSQKMALCGYSSMAMVNSAGISGYGSAIDNTISSPIIDNTQKSYHIYAFTNSSSSDLKIKGALIKYTMPPTLSTPDPWIAIDGMGRMHFFVIGQDHALWDNMGGNWYPLGGYILSNPCAVQRPDDPNHIVIAVKAGDGSLYINDLNTLSMTGVWVGLGGSISSAPFAMDAVSYLSTSVRGADGALWENGIPLWDPGAASWTGHGGLISGAPSAAFADEMAEYDNSSLVEEEGRMVFNEPA